MAKLIDMIGKKFGKLKVIKRAGSNHNNAVMYLCECECGNTKITEGNSLRRGFSKSCGCRKSLPQGEGAFRSLYRQTEYNAWYRGIAWNISWEFFRWVTKQPCHYCGTEPYQIYQPKRINGSYVFNGLDRVDNNKGYTKGNVVPCCGVCNYMKSATDINEFRAWVIQVYNHWASK